MTTFKNRNKQQRVEKNFIRHFSSNERVKEKKRLEPNCKYETKTRRVKGGGREGRGGSSDEIEIFFPLEMTVIVENT